MSASRTESLPPGASDPTGLHRVLDEGVVLPQAAQRLDTDPVRRGRRAVESGRMSWVG